jgi:hypothetical protein
VTAPDTTTPLPIYWCRLCERYTHNLITHVCGKRQRMNLRRFVAVAAVAAGCTACTPEQSAEWFGWRRHDKDGADAWLASPEGQVSLTDPSIDVPAPPPPARPSWGKWAPILQCESNGNWHIETGNGYSGGLQFAHSTWRAYGGTQYASRASQATPEQQIAIAERVLADVGWRAWPTCSRRAGYR